MRFVGVAKLADALDSGSRGGNLVGVQIPSPASINKPSLEFMETIAINRKAKHDFFLFDKFEAGVCLFGHEVKSIREGKINLKDSFVRIVKDEAFLFNCHISPYSKLQGHVAMDPIRTRKLLLHAAEIAKLAGRSSQKGFAIVPISLYLKRGKVKIEIALAQGKKQFDKREDIKKKIHARETSAAVKRFTKK